MKRTSRTLEAYEGSAAHAAIDFCLSRNYKQHGDPAKVAALVYKVAMSDKMPLWLPAGKEVIKKFTAKCERMIDELQWYYDEACDISFPRPEKK